jgi:predicted RecA/RadA family phage recombinase
MRNFVQPGEVITLPAPTGGIKSGEAMLVGAIFGVASFDAAEAADVEVATVGVFELPKDGSVIAQGALLYWDASAAALTTTSTDNTLVGKAVAAAGGSATTVRVLIR